MSLDSEYARVNVNWNPPQSNSPPSTSIQYTFVRQIRVKNDNITICLRISICVCVEARAKRYFYSHNQSHLFDVYTFFTQLTMFIFFCLPWKWAEHKMRKKKNASLWLFVIRRANVWHVLRESTDGWIGSTANYLTTQVYILSIAIHHCLLYRTAFVSFSELREEEKT